MVTGPKAMAWRSSALNAPAGSARTAAVTRGTNSRGHVSAPWKMSASACFGSISAASGVGTYGVAAAGSRHSAKTSGASGETAAPSGGAV